MKAPLGYLDRPIQLLYPLQLHCNRYKIISKQHESDKKKLNVEAKESRPKRTAGAIALAKIKDIAEHNDSENDKIKFECKHSNGGRMSESESIKSVYTMLYNLLLLKYRLKRDSRQQKKSIFCMF